MKKLFVFLALIALVASVNAQYRVHTSDMFTVSGDMTSKYIGQASDTVNGESDAEYITFKMNFDGPYLYQVQADLDEISGSATAQAILEGSNDNSHWVVIDSLATYGKSTIDVQPLADDGTVYIGDVSTGAIWKYLRVKLVISTTGKWDFNYLIVRAVGKND